jgi:hypothetical protein
LFELSSAIQRDPLPPQIMHFQPPLQNGGVSNCFV